MTQFAIQQHSWTTSSGCSLDVWILSPFLNTNMPYLLRNKVLFLYFVVFQSFSDSFLRNLTFVSTHHITSKETHWFVWCHRHNNFALHSSGAFITFLIHNLQRQVAVWLSNEKKTTNPLRPVTNEDLIPVVINRGKRKKSVYIKVQTVGTELLQNWVKHKNNLSKN